MVGGVPPQAVNSSWAHHNKNEPFGSLLLYGSKKIEPQRFATAKSIFIKYGWRGPATGGEFLLGPPSKYHLKRYEDPELVEE
jgi:hypothetical protein